MIRLFGVISDAILMIRGHFQGQNVNFKVKWTKIWFVTNEAMNMSYTSFSRDFVEKSIYSNTLVISGHTQSKLKHAQSIATAKLTLPQRWPDIFGAVPTLQQRFSKGLCELRNPWWVFLLRPTVCAVISVFGITCVCWECITSRCDSDGLG